jgi:pimeloyl-ACP methyl ester carboxylesterase
MKSIGQYFLLFITLLGFSDCSKDDDNAVLISNTYIKNTIQYKSVNGVNANLLSLDIYHYGQTSSQKPVVIYVHGGGFAIGDKANKMTNKQNLFSSLDYILVSINYRLSPENYSTDPNRIMYPSHHNDVADAVKWVYDNIGNYGGNNQKIALLGHSAGAQLVALTGTSNLFLPTRGINLNLIKGVACIDTEGYDVVARGNENNQVYLNAFGQANTFWFEASPINNLFSGTNYPNFFIAKRGSNTRIGYSNAFISKLQSVQVLVSEVTANQYDHEGINNAIGASGETIVTEPLKSFFAECFQ